MYIDFDINDYTTVYEFIEDVVKDNNYYRPSYALIIKPNVIKSLGFQCFYLSTFLDNFIIHLGFSNIFNNWFNF